MERRRPVAEHASCAGEAGGPCMPQFSSMWQEGPLRLWIRGVADTGAPSSRGKRHTPSSPGKVTQPSGCACRCHGSWAGLPAHSPPLPPAQGSGGAGHRHSSQCGLSGQRVACLRPTCLESRAIFIIHSGSRPWAFLCRASLAGDNCPLPRLCASQTDTHPSSTHGANIPHAPSEPQRFHLDSSSLAIKPGRGQRQKSHYHCS